LGKEGSRIDQLVQDFKVVIDVTKHKETNTAMAVVMGAPSTVKDCMTAIRPPCWESILHNISANGLIDCDGQYSCSKVVMTPVVANSYDIQCDGPWACNIAIMDSFRHLACRSKGCYQGTAQFAGSMSVTCTDGRVGCRELLFLPSTTFYSGTSHIDLTCEGGAG